jgi:hypothetical protein
VRALFVVLAACSGSTAPTGGVCTDPPRGPAMDDITDVTAKSGVDFMYSAPSFQGGALVVADLDGDDRPDLVAANRDGGLAVFHNIGGLRFERRDAGIDPTLGARAIAAADFDNDGDRDLVIAGANVAHVYANDGGTFHEVATLASSGLTEGVLATDIDDDGLLDLFLVNYDIRDVALSEDRLYANRGGLVFEPIARGSAGLGWTATAFDYDGDGDRDLYIANDTLVYDGIGGGDIALPVDVLWRNDGNGTFTDVAMTAGLTMPRSSMGGLLDDFDGDGTLDLFVPDFGSNRLFLRDGDAFVDRADELGLAAARRVNASCGPDVTREACFKLSWSSALWDYDRDGDDDLLVVNGETTPEDHPPVMLFERTGAGFVERAPAIGCLDARGMVVTDLDGDGDLDVVIANKDGPLAIYEATGKPKPDRWLRVTLHGRTSNRDGIGAVVALTTTKGTRLRAVGAGGVVHSTGPAEAWFGIATDDPGVSLEVRWPSGARTQLAAPLTGNVVVDEAQ